MRRAVVVGASSGIGREVAVLLEAAKALDCGDLAIVTHDEEGEIAEGGRTIRVVPAWKLLLG